VTDIYGGIKEDGIWGVETTRAAQITWGVDVTGRILHQRREEAQPGLASGWEFDDSDIGDDLLRAFQQFYGLPETGLLERELILTFQARMGTPQDGVLSRPSLAIVEFQRRLNSGDAAGT
jgi:hypothetical protein